MTTTAPWPWIGGADGEERPGYVRNEPSDLGAEAGSHLARFFDGEFARTGRDARCETCAFRPGTIPNQCGATVLDALKSAIEGVPFQCHETERPCGGWAALAAAKGGA